MRRTGPFAALREADDAHTARIAVISDVHGNARAYREALRLVRQRGFDRLLILGDLLTYGCEPLAVLDLTQEAVTQDAALLLKGNHDQLYADLAQGELAYYRTLPDWLRETVDWTAAALGGIDLGAAFSWLDGYGAGEVLFAHANPFGDWTYLNRPADFDRAAQALAGQGRAVGVFGHTHRAKVVAVAPSGECRAAGPAIDDGGRELLPADEEAFIVDPGSVGQPRSDARASTVLFLSPSRHGLSIEHLPVAYDLAAHKQAIAAAALSAATKTKLVGFFP